MTTKTALDMLCQLALETDLSETQLTEYANQILECLKYPPGITAASLIAQLDAMTGLEFAAAVKRAANGNATSTSTRFFRVTRESYGVFPGDEV